MNADIIADRNKYEDWNNPYYMAGYTSGCESAAMGTITANLTLQEDLEDAQRSLAFRQKALDALNTTIEELMDTIDALNKPWYSKLWSKIPKISIQITRR